MTPAPPPPLEASTVFGERLALARRYADLLADEASVRGLIGPAEVPRLWTRHLLNCAVLGELVPEGCEVVDVGSGAGLPGLALAIGRPDLSLVLVEPLLRRSSWLEDVVSRLELSRVRVLRARAEQLGTHLRAPMVTARAVAPLSRLARWCLPLVAPGGELLAMKGANAQTELTGSADELRRLGAVGMEVVSAGAGILSDPTSVVRVRVGTSGRPGRPQAGAGRGRGGSRDRSRRAASRPARRQNEDGGT